MFENQVQGDPGSVIAFALMVAVLVGLYIWKKKK